MGNLPLQPLVALLAGIAILLAVVEMLRRRTLRLLRLCAVPLLGLGLVVIFLNYLEVLPGGMSNAYLGLGLGAICGGIITATQYR